MQVPYGLIIGSYGQKMGMLFLVYMREQVLWTPASRVAASEHWLVCIFDTTPFRINLGLGVLSDATKSVSRAYINNFQDKNKQIAIDMFLVRDNAILLPCVFP